MADASNHNRSQASTPAASSSKSFVWSQIRYLLSTMPLAIAGLVVFSVAAGLAEAGVLAVLAEAALLIAKHQSHIATTVGPVRLHASISAVLALGVGLALARLALGFVTSFIPAWISTSMQATLRSELFDAFTQASWDVQSRDREGHFQELVTNHINGATQAYAVAANLITAFMTFLVLVISAVALSPFAALGIILVAGTLAAVLRPLGNLGQRRADALSHGWLAYAGGVNEAVRLAEEAHVFGAETHQRERLDAFIASFRRPNLHVNWLANLVSSVYQSLIYLLLVVSLLVLYAAAPANLGALGVVVLMLVRSGSYGQSVQLAIQMLRQSQPYVDRLRAAERTYRESTPLVGATPLGRLETLELRDVSFSYDRAVPALKHLNLEVAGGETVGVVGPSGAGKSTLVQILLGLRTPTSGDYLINGTSVSEYTRESWRKAFAYVPQEPRLLHASVTENIRFFRDIPAEAVQRAAIDAGIHDDIMSWSAGYDTIVGPRADAISGGQQQRICLARALAADPALLILDEPTSALDPLAEQVIQDSLKRLRSNLTLLIVAHRMSTLEICERVLVIVDGEVEAFGSVAELLSYDGYYRSALTASLTPETTLAKLASLE